MDVSFDQDNGLNNSLTSGSRKKVSKGRVSKLKRATPARNKGLMRTQRIPSLNSSSNKCKQTLKTNNRALALALENVRRELAFQQAENIRLRRSCQAANEKVCELTHVASLKNSEIEDEVKKRVQGRLLEMKALLNKVTSNLVGTVDSLGDAVLMCSDPTPRSIRSLGSMQSTEESPCGLSPVAHGPQRSIYYTGSKKASKNTQGNRFEESAAINFQMAVMDNLKTLPSLSERAERKSLLAMSDMAATSRVNTAANLTEGIIDQDDSLLVNENDNELRGFRSAPKVLNTNMTTDELLLEGSDVIEEILKASSNPCSPQIPDKFDQFANEDQTVFLSEDMDFTEVIDADAALLFVRPDQVAPPQIATPDKSPVVKSKKTKTKEQALKKGDKENRGLNKENTKVEKSKQKDVQPSADDNNEAKEVLSDLGEDATNKNKTNFQVHLSKLGKISFAAGKKDTGMQVIKNSKLPTRARSKQSSKARSKSKIATAPSKPATEAPSVFDYQGTPTDVRMKVYDVSMNESMSPKRPTLGEFRQQLNVVQIPETPVSARSDSKCSKESEGDDVKTDSSKNKVTGKTRTKRRSASKSDKSSMESDQDSPVQKRARTKTISKPKVLTTGKVEGPAIQPNPSTRVRHLTETLSKPKVDERPSRTRTKTRPLKNKPEEITTNATSAKQVEAVDNSNDDVPLVQPNAFDTQTVNESAKEVSSKETDQIKNKSGRSRTKPRITFAVPSTPESSSSKECDGNQKDDVAVDEASSNSELKLSEVVTNTDAPSEHPIGVGDLKDKDEVKNKSRRSRSKSRLTSLVAKDAPHNKDVPVTTDGNCAVVEEMVGCDDAQPHLAEASVIIHRKASRSKGRKNVLSVEKSQGELEMLAANIPFCHDKKGAVCVTKRAKTDKPAPPCDDLANMFSSDISLLEEYAKPPSHRKNKTTSQGPVSQDQEERRSSVQSVNTEDDGRRSRRGAKAVSYAEPRLGSKLRQGDPGTSTIYNGKDKSKSMGGKKRSALSMITNTEAVH